MVFLITCIILLLITSMYVLTVVGIKNYENSYFNCVFYSNENVRPMTYRYIVTAIAGLSIKID